MVLTSIIKTLLASNLILVVHAQETVTQKDLDAVLDSTVDASESFSSSFLTNKAIGSNLIRPLLYASPQGQYQRETQSPLVWLRLHHNDNSFMKL